MKNIHLLQLTGLLFLHTICWFIMNPQPAGSDDLCYAIHAREILNHEFHLDHSQKTYRFGVILPAVVAIKLAGDHPYAISFIPLLFSLLTISLLFFFLMKHTAETTAFTASLLLSLNLTQITYSTVIFPDVMVSFWGLCFVLTIYKARQQQAKYIALAVLSIFFFIAGFFTKEIIILIFPFVLFLSVKDILSRKQVLFWIYFWLLLLLVIVSILFLSKIFLNDAFYFYTVVEKNHNELYVINYDLPAALKRITYQPLLWLNEQLGYIFLIVFAVPSIISGLKVRAAMRSVESFFAVFFIFLLVMLWCGSSSITRFAPMLLLDRMWMLLLVPLVVLSAVTISKTISNELSKSRFYFMIIAFLFLAVVNFLMVSPLRGMLFASFAIFLLPAFYFFRQSKLSSILKTMLLLFPYILLALYFMATNSNYLN